MVRYFIIILYNYFIIETIVCTCLFFRLPCPEELVDFESEYYLFQSNCDITYQFYFLHYNLKTVQIIGRFAILPVQSNSETCT